MRARGGGRRLDPFLHGPFAYHRRRKLGRRDVGDSRGEHHAAVPEYRHPVGRGECLVQFVRDEHGRAAPGCEAANHAEKIADLRRGQHRGRLIQQKEPGLGRERLHDLESLPEGHAQVLDSSIRIEGQTGLLARLLYPTAKPSRGDRPPRGQRDVLRDRERRYRREVLVDHSDSEPPGLPRRQSWPRYVVHQHDPRVRLEETRRDLHEGRLAGAVLPQERVDFSGGQREIGPVQRVHGAEPSMDTPQLQPRHQRPVG